jgi:hypothetical protein
MPWRSRLVKSYEARAAEADASEDDRTYATERAEQAKNVRAWLASLVDSIPAPAKDGTVGLQAVVDAVLAFLEDRTARNNALDHRAGAALAEYISELRALGDFSCGLPEALRFVRERVESLTVAPNAHARSSLCVQFVAVGLRVAPTSSSSVSRKDASSPVPPKTRCCWMKSVRGSRRTYDARPIASTRRCTAC